MWKNSHSLGSSAQARTSRSAGGEWHDTTRTAVNTHVRSLPPSTLPMPSPVPPVKYLGCEVAKRMRSMPGTSCTARSRSVKVQARRPEASAAMPGRSLGGREAGKRDSSCT